MFPPFSSEGWRSSDPDRGPEAVPGLGPAGDPGGVLGPRPGAGDDHLAARALTKWRVEHELGQRAGVGTGR